MKTHMRQLLIITSEWFLYLQSQSDDQQSGFSWFAAQFHALFTSKEVDLKFDQLPLKTAGLYEKLCRYGHLHLLKQLATTNADHELKLKTKSCLDFALSTNNTELVEHIL